MIYFIMLNCRMVLHTGCVISLLAANVNSAKTISSLRSKYKRSIPSFWRIMVRTYFVVQSFSLTTMSPRIQEDPRFNQAF